MKTLKDFIKPKKESQKLWKETEEEKKNWEKI